MYTVGHKKRATLFGIITPMFRGGFLQFLHQWKQEEILYRGITKFATLPQLCLYTTWENLKTHTTAHFETNCQWILMLHAIKARTSPSELFLLLRVCAQYVHPLLANRLPNDLSIGRQHCQWSAARVRSRRLADAAETFMTCDVTQLWRHNRRETTK